MVVLIFTAAFYACKKDHTDDGLSEQIHNIVPDSIINKMKTLGMPIFGGTKPPDLQHIYLASPFILKSSNISSDYVGKSFADYYGKLYDQDNDQLSIKLDYYNGGERGSGLGGFISGEDNSFSVFVKVHSTYQGGQADVIMVISGKTDEGGIKNFYYANFMLDDYDDPNDVWIGVGQGRVIYDSDGYSPISETMPAKGSLGLAGSTIQVR